MVSEPGGRPVRREDISCDNTEFSPHTFSMKKKC